MNSQQNKTMRDLLYKTLHRFGIAWSVTRKLSDLNGGLFPALGKMLKVFRDSGREGLLAYVLKIIRQEWLSRHVSLNRLYKEVYPFPENTAYRKPGNIAIHIYLDMIGSFSEIADYLPHIPQDWDVYISITDEAYRAIIQETWKKSGRTGRPKLTVVPDKYGHIAPLLVTFAGDVMKKDYVCHVHTDCRQPWQNSQALRILLGPDNIINIINHYCPK